MQDMKWKELKIQTCTLIITFHESSNNNSLLHIPRLTNVIQSISFTVFLTIAVVTGHARRYRLSLQYAAAVGKMIN
jgi:uncharacterized protein YccT (UPF0319 family)